MLSPREIQDLKTRMAQKVDNRTVRVAVVGFGYIGTCIGAVIADRGYSVVGIDVRKSVVDEINSGRTSIAEPGLNDLVGRTVRSGNLKATHDFAAVAECDVIVVTVGTPLGENFDPDTRDITQATEAIAKHLQPGHLVILKSTVPPRTTESVVKPILDRKLPLNGSYLLAFCPERLAEGKAIQEFQSIPVVVGGVDEASREVAGIFWQKILDIDTVAVESATAAELVKLSNNLWIDLNIALANEVALVSEKLGVDALEVIAAANTLPKGTRHVNILFPSVGVGGYCLTKDPWFVHHLGKQMGLELLTPVASRKRNDSMPAYSFQSIQSEIEQSGRKLNQSKVVVLGVSFKNNTGDCRFTPTRPVIEKLAATGCQLEVCDPWVSDEEAQHLIGRKLSRDIMGALKGADAAVFLTGHDEFKALSPGVLAELMKPKSVIFDGRNFMSKAMKKQLQDIGFRYRGVGR